MEKAEFYYCEECHNLVAMLSKGGGQLVCCGQPMKLLVAKTGDVGNEKHVPVITHENGKLIVNVGEINHPMVAAHHIEFIAIETNDSLTVKYLNPEGEPHAEFENIEHGTAYGYCNLHGLWKASF